MLYNSPNPLDMYPALCSGVAYSPNMEGPVSGALTHLVSEYYVLL